MLKPWLKANSAQAITGALMWTSSLAAFYIGNAVALGVRHPSLTSAAYYDAMVGSRCTVSANAARAAPTSPLLRDLHPASRQLLPLIPEVMQVVQHVLASITPRLVN